MENSVNFSEDLQGRYEACRFRARVNYAAAYFSLIFAVATSALATFSISAEIFGKSANAILAAIPGAMYLANRQFRFEERAKWWFDKFYVIEGLYRGLVYEGRDQAGVSQELTEKSKELSARWPGFGEAPG